MPEHPGDSDLDTFYLGAFWALDTQRPMGFGAVGKIPVRDIHWAGVEIAGLEGTSLDIFIHLIREMDAEFMEWQRKKAKEASDNA